MRALVALAAFFSVLPTLCSAESTATLKGVDLYRSSQLSAEQLDAKLGGVIRGFARQAGDSRKSLQKTGALARKRLESEVRALAKFAFVDVYYAPYITSLERTAYITFDVVDEADAKERMPFYAAPTGAVKDPEGLLEAWRQYAALGEKLQREGTLDLSERPTCPSYYCVWGASTPELAQLEKRFVTAAANDKKLLQSVVHQDGDPAKRSAALYVLAYIPEGREVADLSLNALKDPSGDVRSAALQILADISLYHKDVFVDLTRLLPALDYPSTPERSLAMGALVGLADNPSYRPTLLARATPRLLELLKLQQPSNHDLAFTLLSMLSKETYGRRDYAAWQRWVSQQTSGAAASPVPPPASDTSPKKPKK